MIWLKSDSKVRQILLDEEIDEQEFVGIINSIYKQDCYIYAIIPEYEEELFNELSKDFIEVKKFPFPRFFFFPREIGHLGYVKDNQKQYIYMNFIYGLQQ